jgi:DNA adenine methylase
MSCLLAKLHRPSVDVRKPYTQIGSADSFSGRSYDEQYITAFINEHDLPCNNTTAYLTPALRNRNTTLGKGVNLEGRPPQLYTAVLDLLDDVYNSRVPAADLLAEMIRLLIILRNERQQRIESLISTLKTTQDALPLSSEDIVNLVSQHLSLKGTSRLPVLLIAAAYNAAHQDLGQRVLALRAHNAADIQTGALGDIEITLVSDDRVVTSYEMKDKRVTREDLQRALQKLSASEKRVDNYIFISTDEIDREVQEYARSLYTETGGMEFVILDCIGFIRHYLHLFHRLRYDFLEEYQTLILAEPESSVSQLVKEAFLSMRQAAEAG